ncbi:cytochrome P450 [Epithele typhae]|uniref:cytochrome P450 n=1 Tax=Epithele typhae TaxID=378194 RepID=UPI002008A355|nr:cytochrome P450 [Epithele typhae]KAH9933612.1 cytochrome P450 [Epithele typhae]
MAVTTADESLFVIDAVALRVGFFSLVLVYNVATVVYNLWLSPLASIPGPWYAAASDAWFLFQSARLAKCGALHQLFERYGPVVRVGPRKVVFLDERAARTVYCVNKLEKSAFYKMLVIEDQDHSMTMLSEADHSARRKTYAAHYSPSNVPKFQSEVYDCVARLVDALEKCSTTGSVDAIHLLRHLLVDVLAITIVGSNPTALKNWASAGDDPIATAARDVPLRAIFRAIMPTWLWRCCAYFPSSRWRALYRSETVLAAYVRDSLEELHRKQRSEGTFDGPVPLMPRLLSQRTPKVYNFLSDQELVSECVSHLTAGVDASSTTFGFMLWELSRRPDIVVKLRCELDGIAHDRHTLPDYAVLQKQPYLSAFLNEGLRMYGAVSSMLERVVPAREDAFDLMGHALPPGTVVGTQAWSMHRDPTVFPSPECFDPDRWLPAPQRADDDVRVARMQQHLMPFGAGTRVCPGRYQALLLARATISALVLNFDVSADARETNAATMAPRDTFVVRPAAMECKLTFTPRGP